MWKFSIAKGGHHLATTEKNMHFHDLVYYDMFGGIFSLKLAFWGSGSPWFIASNSWKAEVRELVNFELG